MFFNFFSNFFTNEPELDNQPVFKHLFTFLISSFLRNGSDKFIILLIDLLKIVTKGNEICKS